MRSPEEFAPLPRGDHAQYENCNLPRVHTHRSVTHTPRRTKNRRDRSLPIHIERLPVLKGTKQSSDGLVFHGPREDKIKPDTVRNILIKQVIAPMKERFPTPPGAPGFEHGRLHSFRHALCHIGCRVPRRLPATSRMRANQRAINAQSTPVWRTLWHSRLCQKKSVP